MKNLFKQHDAAAKRRLTNAQRGVDFLAKSTKEYRYRLEIAQQWWASHVVVQSERGFVNSELKINGESASVVFFEITDRRIYFEYQTSKGRKSISF